MNYVYDPDALYHYGAIGMKWGVRKGNYSKVYAKAGKKMGKLANTALKREETRLKKSGHHLTDFGVAAYKKATRKADKSKYDAVKWYSKMEKHLGEKKASELLSQNASPAGANFIQDYLKKTR